MRKKILLLFVILIMMISLFAFSSCNANVERSESNDKTNSTEIGTSVGQAEAKGILSADVNENGELILTFTDGTSVNLGVVTGGGDKDDKGDSGSIEDAKYIIASGNAGDNIEWVIDNFHVLTFSGEGKMKEYYTGSSYNPNKVIPWHAYDGFVEKVVIEEGITSICRFAFLSFYNCSEFVIPETVKEIGYCAFEYSGVKDLSFWPKSVAIIKSYTFMGCHNFNSEVYIPSYITEIEPSAFSGSSDYLYTKEQPKFYVSQLCNIQESAFGGYDYFFTD